MDEDWWRVHGPHERHSPSAWAGHGLYPPLSLFTPPALPQVDALRRMIHALGARRALVFMNWQQRLKDVQFKLEARAMQVHGAPRGL